MKKLIQLILLILLSAKSNAETFTILAKSGLNVRKEPNATAEKLGSLPFGTVVDAEINYETDLANRCQYKHFSEIIEGKRGFWMKISHGQLEGYIFSGFGLVGEWIVPATAINNDYRILRVGLPRTSDAQGWRNAPDRVAGRANSEPWSVATAQRAGVPKKSNP